MSDETGIGLVPSFETLCYICLELGEKSETDEVRISCPTCGNPYCPKHASKVDPSFCQRDLKDFEVEEKVFTKVEEDYSTKTNEFTTRKSSCKQVLLKGTDWLFYQHAIELMSDEQLKLSLRWHKAAISLVEHQIDTRKVEANKKLKGVSVTIRSETKTTKVTKTRVKKELTAESIAKMAAAVAKYNLTPEQLQAFISLAGNNKREGDIKP